MPEGVSSKLMPFDFGESTMPLVTRDGGELKATSSRNSNRGEQHMRQRLELALGTSGLGMFDICLETGQCFADHGCLEILGYTEKALPSTLDDCKTFVHPDDLPLLIENFELYLQGKLSEIQFEYRVLHRSGKWLWVLTRGKVVEWSDRGEPVWFTGTLLDISSRKTADSPVPGQGKNKFFPVAPAGPTAGWAEDRDLFQFLLDAIPCPVFYKNTEGVFLGCNSAFEEYFGYSRRELVGNSSYQLAPRELARVYQETDMNLLRSGGDQIYELQAPSPQGSRLMMFKKTVFGSPEPAGFVGVLTDITDLRKTEAELRESERRYREVVENAQSIIIRTDPMGNIIFVNEFAQEFFGYPEGGLVGRNIIVTFPPTTEYSPDYFGNTLDIANPDSKRIPDNECENVRRNGERVWVNWKNRRIIDEEGRIREILCVGSDITDIKRVGDELRRKNQALSWEVEVNSIMAELSRKLMELDSLDDIAMLVLENAKKLTLSPLGFIGHIDLETATIVSPAFVGEDAYPFCDGDLLKAFQDFSQWTSSRDETVLANGLQDPTLLGLSSDGHFPLFKVLSVPAIAKDKLVGRIVLANSPRDYTEHDAALLRGLAALYAMAAQNLRAALDLQRTNEYLENILESSPDAIGIVDRNGKFIRWNRMAHDLYGYTFEEIEGKSAHKMYPDGAELERMLAELRALGTVKKHEIHIRCKDGHVGLYELSIALLKDMAGKVFGSVCVSRDPSPLKKIVEDLRSEIELRLETEEALRHSEAISREKERKYRNLFQEYHALLDAIPDRLLLQDRDYRVVWANRAAAAEIQMEDDIPSLIGTRCHEQWHKLEKPCDGCPMAEVFATGRGVDGEISTIDGRTLEVRSVPVKDDQGNTIHAINVTRDLTEYRKLERQIRHGQKMEAIGTLAGGIAHDFNNILGIILGYSELALTGTARENSVYYQLEQVQKAIYRAKELVKQILTFSRHTDPVSRPVRPSSIMLETYKLLRAAVPSVIEITQEIEPAAESELIQADPTQIQQVLMNLCTNAVHAMREHGGTLHIGLSQKVLSQDEIDQPDLHPGPYACLTVSDTGHGMTQSVMERIFEPFFSTKGPGEGTGMGLSVVYGIVKSHKGAIKVSSNKESGTEFHVYFPSCKHAATVGEKHLRPPLHGAETILLVDDEPELVDVGKKLLENLGYRVIPSVGALHALEVFRADPTKFDLVLTDFTMPYMTGIELAEKLLQLRQDIPVILVTGFSETMSAEQSYKMGIREFLMKPLINEELSHCIRRVLDFS